MQILISGYHLFFCASQIGYYNVKSKQTQKNLLTLKNLSSNRLIPSLLTISKEWQFKQKLKKF